MNNFPYTNFHEINLDWILKHIGEMQPAPVIWEATGSVEEDPDNPGTFNVTFLFTDVTKYLNALERGTRVIMRYGATQYNPKLDDTILGVAWTVPRNIYTLQDQFTQDPDTDTITVTWTFTP